mmetsp:Transcript_20798/g.37042  ORF Transcript_20798/g.37042 Transcript_20798/m.37042 type:complete len:188 (-) Transcript_20798:189-752(-)|eukprot:CAMPEP_0197514884 /NCGR_PEP_ID=MMETSP1318-20131121/186_1 /TAXON_ID=552666 /ORGANISM="Partenskyella glossopodia, Strain RCC365" /LENGTH=187 /DNA_ID=CAMNT_0043063099 /DNA_START=70 /DNA_END=633 /DNA_ORIENTATION=+
MAKKKGGKKKKGGDVDPLKFQSKLLEIELESMRHQLVMQTNKANGAEVCVRMLRKKYDAAQKAIEDAKGKTFEISAEMTRHYKSMRMKMQEKIDELQKKIVSTGDELVVEKTRLEETIERKEAIIAEKDKEIETLNNKMQQMQEEFKEMLAKISDGLQKKIQIDSTGVEKNRIHDRINELFITATRA